jgi:hypothetical protein
VTLVLSLITDKFVCHASDRRLTNALTGRQVATKASKSVVVLPMRMLFSYTGLSQLEGVDTDEWLVRAAYELRKSDDFLGDLGRRAATAISNIALPASAKRHAFVVSGWFSADMVDQIPPETGHVEPAGGGSTSYQCVVSNFLGDNGHWMSTARAEFIHRMRLLPPTEPFHVLGAGVALTESEVLVLDKGLASAFRARSAKERAASTLLIRAIDTVAARDPTVGSGVFVSALARTFFAPAKMAKGSDLRVMGVKWGLPDKDEATFVHIPDSGDEIVESPFVVTEKIAAKMTRLRTSEGIPTTAGVGRVPDEGEFAMRVIKLAD